MGAFYGCVDKMKLVVVTFVLALNLLVRCQAPETVIAQFRYLDYMNEEQRCNIAISLQSKITTCGSALQTPSQFIVGMGRELFIETNETRYGPDYPTGPGSASTSILSNLHQWSTDFGQGMGGISEYTLDGFGSNPDEIDVGNDDDWGLSPRDGSNVTDFTANGAYALYFEISTQFTFQLDISIFDNQERLLNFTLIPVSINSGNFIPYVVPYTFFEYANSSAGLGGFDLTHIGALDLFAYQVENNDFRLRYLGIFGHTISGIVYLDCDGDCFKDQLEPAQQVLVTLTNITSTPTVVGSETSDVNGFYQFTVSNGQYRVCLSSFDSSDYSACFNTGGPNPDCYVIDVPTTAPTDPSDLGQLVFTDYPGNDFPLVPVETLSDPPNDIITCAENPDVVVPRAQISSSQCGGGGSVTYDDSMFPCNAQSSAGTILRTYTATFYNGQTATTTQVITVQDQGPPVFISPFPQNTNLNCSPTPCTSLACLGNAFANDDCAVPFISSSDTFTQGCSEVYTRTFIADDFCGSTSSFVQTFTITDNDDPTFSNFPTDRSVTCGDIVNGTNLGGNPTVSDPCQGTATLVGPIQSTPPSGGCGTVLRTWTASDGCGHTTTRVQRLTVADNEPPRITAPPPTTITCDATNPTFGDFQVSDNCAASAADIATGITLQGQTSTECGSFTRVFTASDGCNPTVSAVQTVTVVDTTPPYFATVPAPEVTFNCQVSGNAPVLTLEDDCSGPATTSVVASSSQPAGPPCSQSFVRTWTGFDNCGVSTSYRQTVHLTDTTPPILTLPSTTSIPCDESRAPGATATAGTATAFDSCAGAVVNVPVVFTDNPTTGSCSFSITRTWTATDSCNNPTQGIQILNIFDDEPPTWNSFPSNIEVPCSGSIPVQQPVPADNCNGVTGLTFNDTPSDAACPDLLVINRVWRVQDGCGTSTSRTQVITLTDDAFPIATAPASVTIPCSSSTDPSVLGTASFALGCPAYEDPSRVTITFSDQRSVNNCPTTILRTWTVTDACNQQDTDTQIITLTDTVPPTFDQSTLPPLTIEVQCGDPFPPVDIAFSDNCDPNPQLTATTGPPVELPAVGQCPADTRVIRTWTVTDNCGLSQSYSQTVIIDNTPPSPCTPVNCIPQPCDTSSCPDQNCDCCSGEALPCSPVPCSSAPCSSTPCIAVPCSGCDFPTQVTTCQPRVCPPQYIYINDDDAAAANRDPLSQVKKVKNYPGVSGASNLVVSAVLLMAVLLSAILTLF